jgi:WD40 repeat protein
MRPEPKQSLRDFRAPDEASAERRAWTVVHAAYLEREPVRKPRSHLRFALVPALAVIAAALVLSPAGAKVERIISHALGVAHASRALYSLPSSGRILVSDPGGTWTAAADGSIRHLGSWTEASWSPHGLYVVVDSGDRLAALDPGGNIRWAIARPHVSDPRWYPPSGYRIAYLSGGTLRGITGSGRDDHLLAAHVAHVSPAWRPGLTYGPYEVAYVTDSGLVVVRDADTGQVLRTASPGARPRELMWSRDGQRLVIVTAHAARIYSALAPRSTTITLPRRDSVTDAALSPDGRTLALVLNHAQVVVAGTGSSRSPMRHLPAGQGVDALSWSPDGRWLVVSWPAANQWMFLRVAGAPRVAAVSRITQQFSAHGTGGVFPRLEGWCCTAEGPAG